MSVANYDFCIRQGDDKTVAFQYKSGNVGVDITDYVIEFVCADPSLNQTASITDVSIGKFSLTFTEALTAPLADVCLSYKVVFYPTGLSGVKNTKYEGKITVDKDDLA
tara:strand:+ start:373 stop:696 length:324 start_codon:yes stop_codon:yes gene_type:complete